MSSVKSMGSVEYMKKRVPRNPKYRHVKSKLDTGCSLIKYMEKMEELKKNYRYRKGELFKRLKVSTFAQLVIQVASVSDMNDVLIDEETSGLDGKLSPLSDEDVEQTNGTLRVSPEPFIDDESDSEAAVSPRSTLQSLVSGVGELDMESHGQRKSSQGPVSSPGPINQPYPDCPYLLLDVRDREDYAQCHLISAYSYPVATLSRTMDPYTKEVLEYKNVPGKIIIVYDEDERIASVAATTMCERGFENVFMLSGGLRVIAKKFPEGMTTGSLPTHFLRSAASHRSLLRGPLRHESRPAEVKWRFTSEDLRKIQQYQEEMLMPTASNSQVTLSSKSSSLSKSSSSRSQRVSSAAGTDSSRSQSSRPWR